MSLAINTEERADARLLAVLLRASVQVIGFWALLLSTAMLIAWLLVPKLSPWLMALGVTALCLGATERIVAFRLALDQHLFEQLAASEWHELSALDAALARLGLRQAINDAPTRPWTDRVQGTRRLFLWHVALVLLQTSTAFLFLFGLRFLF
jgi:hypothetical protein